MPVILAPDVGSPSLDGEENDTQPVHYEIVQTRPLPRVDMYKTLKLVLLGVSGARAFTQVQRRFGKLVTALYVSGLIISIMMLFAPAPVGRPLAAIATTLEFPILVMGIMSLRPEMIRVLLRTYEFWFFSVMSVGALISMVFYYRDLRSVQCSIIWTGNMFAITADAALQGMNHMYMSMVVSFVYNSIFVIFVGLELIDKTHSFRVFQYGTRSVQAEDVISMTISALIYLQVRSVYRNGVLTKRRSGVRHQFRCASYRCKVMLRRVYRAESSAAVLKMITLSRAEDSIATSGTNQMEHIKIKRVFDARQTVCGLRLSSSPWPQWRRLLLQSCGSLGLALNCFSFVYLSYASCHPQIALVLVVTALGCSSVFCGFCFALYNPQLLRHLCFSFDFFFLSIQLIIMHLSACDICFWDLRAIVLATSLLWTHWVLTIDAFMPIARRKIGFKLRHCALVLLTLLVGEALFMYETASGARWHLQDRSLLKFHVFGRSIDVRVMPLLFTRIWILFLWECRVLWRASRARKNHLIIIHGAVAFNTDKTPFQVAQIAPHMS